MTEGGRRAATTHLATAPTAPTESRARPHEATTVTTTVEQQVSDNKVTGHHAWDRVCDHPNGQTQPTDRIGMQGESSGAVEQPSVEPNSRASRRVEPNSRTEAKQYLVESSDRTATT